MSARIGIYNLWLSNGGGSEKRTLAMAEHLSRRHEVTLIVGEDYPLARLSNYHHVDLSRVGVFRVYPRAVGSLRRNSLTAKWTPIAARLAEPLNRSSLDALKLDVFINNQWGSNLHCPARRGVYMCMFPHPARGDTTLPDWRSRIYSRLMGLPRSALDTYSVVTANSEYTRGWIQRRWQRDAEVVYSACEPMGPSVPKERIIVHVGRFVGESRPDHKFQGAMLEAFLRLEDLHAEGWHLHFAGSVPRERKALRFADDLVKAARHHPVSFHFNAPFQSLRDLYQRASVYWHATGYGVPPDQYPGHQEHFGMTTVEAMSAGCVPVVVNTGGQREIVRHSVSGFLWDDLDGLRQNTRRLTRDPALLERMSQQAVADSHRFSRSAFLTRIDALVERLLSAKGSPNA